MMGAINKTNFNFMKIGVMTLNSYFSREKKTQSLVEIKMRVMKTKRLTAEQQLKKRKEAVHVRTNIDIQRTFLTNTIVGTWI